MKQKDIDKCHHITLSTHVDEILNTMLLELPTVRYFFIKDYGGKHRHELFERRLMDKALEEESSQVTPVSEYISQKGNRWISYKFAEYFEKARFTQVWNTSFVYYETYGSCGAFFPIIMNNTKTKQLDKVEGVVIYTSHFFQRMSERTGKAYRSRELIQEFITTMQTHATQADEEGEVIVKFKGGYGFGKKRSDNPLVLEVRTFLADEQLSNKQRKKCERVNAYAELIQDGMFMKDVRSWTAYYSKDTEEQMAAKAKRNLFLTKKLGLDRYVSLATLVHTMFLRIMCNILHKELKDIPSNHRMVIVNETQECYEEFLNKYEFFNAQEASEEENNAFVSDLVDCMVRSGKKLGLKSITRDAIYKELNEAKYKNGNC